MQRNGCGIETRLMQNKITVVTDIFRASAAAKTESAALLGEAIAGAADLLTAALRAGSGRAQECFQRLALGHGIAIAELDQGARVLAFE